MREGRKVTLAQPGLGGLDALFNTGPLRQRFISLTKNYTNMVLEQEFIVMIGLLTMFSIVAVILKTLKARLFNI